MQKARNARQQIADKVWDIDGPAAEFGTDDDFAAFYTAMYLVDDASLGIEAVQSKGFSSDSGLAYLELWGLLQAVIIIQDSICELNRSVGLGTLKPNALGSNSQKLRELRNQLGGHPVRQGSGNPNRSFLGRNFGRLNAVKYEQYSNGALNHPTVNIEKLLHGFDQEAAGTLNAMFTSKIAKW
jgi:hypothetical protein